MTHTKMHRSPMVLFLAAGGLLAGCTIVSSDTRQPASYDDDRSAYAAGSGKPVRGGEATQSRPKPVARGDNAGQTQTDATPSNDRAPARTPTTDTDEPENPRVRAARLSETEDDALEPFTQKMDARVQSVVAPLDEVESELDALRDLATRYNIPAGEVQESLDAAVGLGRIEVPERVPDAGRDAFRDALRALQDADDVLANAKEQARVARLAVRSLERQAQAEIGREQAGRGAQGRAQRQTQLEQTRLEQRLDEAAREAAATLGEVPERVRTLQWRLENVTATGVSRQSGAESRAQRLDQAREGEGTSERERSQRLEQAREREREGSVTPRTRRGADPKAPRTRTRDETSSRRRE